MKKIKNNTNNKNTKKILPSLNIWPIIIVGLIWWSISFMSQQSTININKRNDATYENKLIKAGYMYTADIKYKKAIIANARQYSLPELEFLMGPQELEEYIKKFDDKYSYYAYGQYNPVKDTYLTQKKLRANLNIHSNLTDGNFDIKTILDQSAKYADAVAEFYPDEPYIIAITDINTIEGCKEIIDTINSSPSKYKNLRIVFGVEIPTTLEANKTVKETSKVNLLALCINPFNHSMKKTFPKFGLVDTYDTIDHNYDSIVKTLNNESYLIYGIAKPLQDIGSLNQKYKYIDSLFKYYSDNNKGFKFIEAYYDPYIYLKTPEAKYMIEAADLLKLHKIGSLEKYNSESLFNSY